MKRVAVLSFAGTALAIAAACSSGGGPSGGGGAGGSASISSGASTVTASSAASAGGSSGSSSSGAGGMESCAACVVVAMVPSGSAPHGIFVDADNVYWTHAGTGEVMQAKTDGSALVTLATAQGVPYAVEVRGGFVYWISYSADGVMRRAPIGGGPLVDVTPAPAARELAVGADFIWWTREPDDIQRVPLTGLPDGGEPDLLSANPLTNGIAIDETHVYWVNRQEGSIKKANHALGGETPLAKGDIPWDIAVDGARVYWTERGATPGTGKVMAASKVDGSGATELAKGQASPQGIAVDETSVYWANFEGGSIHKAPLAGGAVTVLAAGQQKPVNVAVDATHVYWANVTGESIVKVAK